MYSAVVLSEESSNKLKATFGYMVPKGWKLYCHHMTIRMGSLPEGLQKDFNSVVDLIVTHVGTSDTAIAVKVDGYFSQNSTPHITVATSPSGKPKDSNYIQNWQPVDKKLRLDGTVCLVGNDNKIITEQVNIDLTHLPFYKDILKSGGKIYRVGGSVRDQYLNKKSKDLDIVIGNLPIETVEQILQRYGTVNNVGKSFGIIKFLPKGASQDEEIDIGFPRTDVKNSEGGYQGFDVTTDPFMPIEDDLGRRDFTINSIAVDHDNNIIDPHDGIGDIKKKIIKATSKKSFIEDPLRILRGIQFASRFGFSIEPNTFRMIKDNAYKIKQVSPERILIEFEKIISKGDPYIGIKLLIETGLFDYIFKEPFSGDINKFRKVKTMAEFIHCCTDGMNNPAVHYWKKILKGDNEVEKQLIALNQLEELDTMNIPEGDIRTKVGLIYTACPSIKNSEFVFPDHKKFIEEFDAGKYPASVKDLDINGNDVLSLGFKDRKIGQILNYILYAVNNNFVTNEKEELIRYIDTLRGNL